MNFILDKHGYAGTHAFSRLLEEMCEHFNLDHPLTFVFNARDLVVRVAPLTSRRTVLKMFKTFQDRELLSFLINGKEIVFNCSIIYDLLDETTKKKMRKNT